MSASPPVPEIEFEGVSKSYGTGRLVLQSVDLKIRERRVRQHYRPFGVRQIHGTEIDLRADAAERRDDSRGRDDAGKRA